MTTRPTFLTRLESQDDWARKLGKPSHMKVGRSAHGLSTSWLGAGTIPSDVREVLDREPALANLEPLLVVAEHQVPLPGGEAASQCDAWVLARRPTGSLVSIGVEAKVDEPFGETIEEWRRGESVGKQRRLRALLETLEVSTLPESLRYQLVHRTAAPILEANRFGADTALLLVQSFDEGDAGFLAYQEFVSTLGGKAAIGSATSLGTRSGVGLWAAWIRSPSPAGYAPARPDLFSQRIDLAMRLSSVAHALDNRKGTAIPYISHPMHVARLLEYDGWSEEVIVAGLLHDVLEDLEPTDIRVQARFKAVFPALVQAPLDGAGFAAAVAAFVRETFGSRVKALVDAVTEKKVDSAGVKRDWIDRKKDVIRHLEKADAEVVALKAADVVHNVRSILHDVSYLGVDTVTRRFNAPRADTLWYYEQVTAAVGPSLTGRLLGRGSRLPNLLRRSVIALRERIA